MRPKLNTPDSTPSSSKRAKAFIRCFRGLVVTVGALLLLSPQRAHANPLSLKTLLVATSAERNAKTGNYSAEVQLTRSDDSIVLRVRGKQYQLQAPKIVRSTNQVKVYFPGASIAPKRYDPKPGRLESIDVRNSGSSAVITLSQRPDITDPLRNAFSAEGQRGDVVLSISKLSVNPSKSAPAKSTSTTHSTAHANGKVAKNSDSSHKKSLEHLLQAAESAPTVRKGKNNAEASQHNVDTKDKPGHSGVPIPDGPLQMDEATPGNAQAAGHDNLGHNTKSPEHSNAHPGVGQSPPAFGETKATNKHSTKSSTMGEDIRSTLVTSLSILGILGLLALIPLWVWKKRFPHESSSMQVLERMALTNKHSLLRVRIDGKELLLGLSEGNIQALHFDPEQRQSASTPASPQKHAFASPAPLGAVFGNQSKKAKPSPEPIRRPPSDATRKLKAFKSRLADALRMESKSPKAQDETEGGHQADAIRRELRRRANEPTLVASEDKEHAA